MRHPWNVALPTVHRAPPGGHWPVPSGPSMLNIAPPAGEPAAHCRPSRLTRLPFEGASARVSRICRRARFFRPGRPAAGDCPGCHHRRSADAGLHESRELRRNAAHRRGRLLQPQPRQAVARKAKRAATSNASPRFISTATPTPSCCGSSRSAEPLVTRVTASCFFRRLTPQGLEIVGHRVFDPRQVYGQ